MNQDTIYLLRECNAGFKSATNSMEQVIPYISDEKLLSIINEYNIMISILNLVMNVIKC